MQSLMLIRWGRERSACGSDQERKGRFLQERHKSRRKTMAELEAAADAQITQPKVAVVEGVGGGDEVNIEIVLPPSAGEAEEEEEEGGEGRDGAVSPQFSTTSTLSGEGENTNPFTGSDLSLERSPAGTEGKRVAQVLSNGATEVATEGTDGDITVSILDVPAGSEALVASTAGTWERFEPATSKAAWEVFETSGEQSGEQSGEASGGQASTLQTVTAEVHSSGGGEEEEELGKENGSVGATAADSPKRQWEQFEETSVPVASRAVQKKLTVPAEEHGAVCAADALLSSGWTALDDSSQRVEEREEDSRNLPFRKTQSMRATAHRKVQIVDALKQQRRLSNSSLDREPSKGGGLFSNEDELSRRYNMEREWQLFVKMNKRVPGTRTKWMPVNMQVKDGLLVIKRSSLPSMPLSSATAVPPEAPPLHEIRLCHNHTLTQPVSRPYDRKTKVHQIKLQQTRIREKRTLKRWLFVDHVSRGQTIVKLGCPDLGVVESLSEYINEAIRQLPVSRQQGVAYRMNEVFVDVKDQSDILMNCDGAVLERRSLNRVYIQAFITGSPLCRIMLNDVEAILLQGKGGLTASMSRQVRLSDVVLHPCVDHAQYKATREIKFTPIDGYPFEVLRGSVEPYKSPPINVNALMEFNEARNTVSITAKFTVRKKFNVRLEPIRDLMFKFPIMSSWSGLFLADTKFGTRSVQSTSALRGSFRRKVRSASAKIEVHLGSAKYEPEHGAVVWRIGHYLRTDTPHTFRCDIQLKQGMHKPSVMDEHCEVMYTIPGSSTGLEVRSFKAEGHSPERWVKYEILYHYRVQMFPDLSMD